LTWHWRTGFDALPWNGFSMGQTRSLSGQPRGNPGAGIGSGCDRCALAGTKGELRPGTRAMPDLAVCDLRSGIAYLLNGSLDLLRVTCTI
jgi:hypothetical protein